jgi:diguanylate cyclase (GGDEF)-like protein
MRLPSARTIQEPTVTLDGPSRDPRASLSAAIAAAAAADDPDHTLQRILDAALDGIGATMGAIVLRDPDRPGLTLVAASGVPAEPDLARDVQEPGHPFARVVAERQPVWDLPATAPDGRESMSAYLPLVIGAGGVDETLGALGLSWPAPRRLDAAERSFLGDITGIAALAADRARLASTASERSEWFERMAHTDPLTGLANERTVSRILELELARAARQGSEVSIAIFDVDDFRATNDAHGHEAGDDVLRQVAAVLAETVRLVDTVGRIGGDEFVLVAPGSAGGLVARRVLDGISALPADAGRAVSVSAGVARFPTDGADSESLIAAATAALGQAKAGGTGTVAESPAEAGALPEG